MAGKYAKLKGTLKPFQLEESYQQKVSSVKDQLALSEMSIGQLAELFIETQDMLDQISAQEKAQNTIKEAVQQELIKALEEDNLTSLRSKGGLLYTQNEPYTSVKDKEAYIQYVKDNGYENLLSVPYQSTNAMAKELLIAGEQPPPGTEVFMKTTIRYRRS